MQFFLIQPLIQPFTQTLQFIYKDISNDRVIYFFPILSRIHLYTYYIRACIDTQQNKTRCWTDHGFAFVSVREEKK
jgi:hypothetical protein